MAAEFGADSAAIGWIPTASFGGFLAGIALVVPLGDRMDKRRLIVTQHFAAICALLAAAAAPDLASAAAAGFLIGLCACYSQSIIPLVAELAPPDARGRAVGTVLSTLFLGILFARIAGGIVATEAVRRISGNRGMRMLSPEIIRACAVYLASDESSRITGQSLVATDWNAHHGFEVPYTVA